MIFKNIHNVYFVGIGGIGMSALAKYFLERKKQVAGYDKTKSTLINNLQKLGASVHFEDDISQIPKPFLDPKKTLVVYTPAVKNHKELHYFSSNNFLVLKRAVVLAEITKSSFNLAVAGTHGKTTTTSILGHIFQSENATSFLGGIAENYNSNLILGDDKITIVEADEFDRSFLQLQPNIACITSIDADHLDIYENKNEFEKSFFEFANQVSGTLVFAKGLPFKGLTFAIDEKADYTAENIRIKNGNYIFDIVTPRSKIENICFQLPGKHNIMNALAAVAMADVYGISLRTIKESLESFQGVTRRFSYAIKTDSLVLIDDYAHHPTELNAVISSVKEMYPNEKIAGIFQPHLYSRTKDFADGFAFSLSKLDAVFLLDIYSAREHPIKGITSAWLLEKIDLKEKELIKKEQVVQKIKNVNSKIVLMMGAGDIGDLVSKVKLELT